MFDMSNLNPSKRYIYGEESNKEYVDFRLVSDEKMQEIRKAVGLKTKQKYIPNPSTKRMDTVQDLDISDENMSKFNDAMICYQIEDWCLIQKDKTEIPCTDENKKKLYYGSPVFAKWANACLTKMQGEIDEIEEAEVKN